jgi:hypothetical protein
MVGQAGQQARKLAPFPGGHHHQGCDVEVGPGGLFMLFGLTA